MSPKPCVVCECSTTHTFGPEREEQRYPLCEECHKSGRHEQWQAKAISELLHSRVVFESVGNLAEDYKKLQRWNRHNSRIEDGVCPNGCATLVDVGPGESECPVCGFHLSRR